jgi:hypothetical protein
MRGQPYSVTRDQILEVLKEHPHSKSKFVAMQLGMSWKNTRRIMSRMKEEQFDISFTHPECLWHIRDQEASE